MPTRRALPVLLILTIAASACHGAAGPATSLPADGFEISGVAHAGPVCPVVQIPPDPACDDRPVEGAELTIVSEAGVQVDTTRTASDGTFTLTLPAGSYQLIPSPVEGLLGTAPPIAFTVVDGPVQGLDVAYDTGIR